MSLLLNWTHRHKFKHYLLVWSMVTIYNTRISNWFPQSHKKTQRKWNSFPLRPSLFGLCSQLRRAKNNSLLLPKLVTTLPTKFIQILCMYPYPTHWLRIMHIASRWESAKSIANFPKKAFTLLYNFFFFLRYIAMHV